MVADYLRRGVHGQTVEALARRILSGEIPEGATLDLPAICAELDVSMTAMREALKVLATKGIIDARQKRGTFVRPQSTWHVLDSEVMQWRLALQPDLALLEHLAEVRGIVEPAAARLAAQRATEADLVALQDALAGMTAASGTVERAVAADVNFHTVLLAATHNPLLAEVERSIIGGLAQRDAVVHTADATDDPVPSHRAVFEAIRARDADGAHAAMRMLIDKASADLRRVGDQG